MIFHLLQQVYIQSLKRVRVFPLGGHFTRIQKPLQKPFISAFEGILGGAILNGGLVAAVQSDIVGYTTMTTEPGFNMLGAVFNGLDGVALPLAEVLSGDFQDGDEIQVYDKESGYTVYSYWKDFGGWLDGNFDVATKKVAPGTSFWLKTPGRSVEVILRGAVPTGEYKYVSKLGVQMVSPGLPVALDLNSNVSWTGLTDGDEIQVRKGNVYTIYSYWNGYGWLDGNFEPVSEKLPMGSSFWLKTQKEGVSMTLSGISQ